jgi:acetolactate synthase-1/3 small subunit
MQKVSAESATTVADQTGRILLELRVNNHPGVMSHICGLFARRAYNLEKIICFPRPESSESRMWLQVNEENRLEQVVRQIEKLEDVLQVQCHHNNPNFFTELEIMVNRC